MKLPSKHMPAAPVPQMHWWQWALLFAIVGGLLGAAGSLVYLQPSAIFVLAGIVGFIWIVAVLDTRSRRRLAAARQGESICDFARSFDYRKTDTWILRAVYEEFSGYLAVDGKPVPIRAVDRYQKDLGIDEEDMDDLAEIIADRARRSLEGREKNPLFDRVETIADVVKFFEHQPRMKTLNR